MWTGREDSSCHPKPFSSLSSFPSPFVLPHIPRFNPHSGFIYLGPPGMRSTETFVRRQVTGGGGGAGRARMWAGHPPAGALGAGGEARWDRVALWSGGSSLPRTRAGSPKVSVHASELGGNQVDPRDWTQNTRWTCWGCGAGHRARSGGRKLEWFRRTSPWKPQVEFSF